jgi:glycosyltransferase involved in cell wall biosynthesis
MHKKPPVVLLIIPNLTPGGAQNVFRQQYEYLSQHYTVQGCVFNWNGTEPTQWPNTITSLNVPGGANAVQKIRFFLKRIVRLRALKKQLNVSVSISHLEGADYVNVLSGIGEKKILWIHGTKKFDAAIRGWVGYIRRSWLMPWLYKRATQVVTVSKAIAHELKTSYPSLQNKLQTIYNGIDYPRIQQLKMVDADEAYQTLCNNHIVIVTHCRLALQKNVAGLMDVIAAFTKKNLNVKWVIIGDGDLRNSLTEQCDHLNIDYYAAWKHETWAENKTLYFLGYQSNPFPFLSKAKVYVMPSAWEGFPLALCEALACALPVIASDCYTGPREILAPGECVLPLAKKPEYAQYGVLMPLIHDQSIPMWVEELSTFITNINTYSHYAAAATQRAQELSLEKSLEEVSKAIQYVLYE